MAEMSIQQAFGLAIRHLDLGRFDQAESLFHQILTVNPEHADSLHLLGVLARRNGNNQSAINLIRGALASNPTCSDANFNLGNALRDQGQTDEAILAYRRAIALRQNVHESYHNLGCLLRDKGLAAEASEAFELSRQLSAGARQSGGTAQNSSSDWFDIGNSMGMQRRYAEAIQAYRNAISINPEFAEAHCNLGNALVEAGQLEAAIAAFRKSIQLNPNLPQSYLNLGKALYDRGELDQAIAANRQAISLRSDYAVAFQHLANCLFETGQLDEAIGTLRRMPRTDAAENAKADSNLIYCLYFHPDQDARSIARETDKWNLQYAKPLIAVTQPHLNDRDPNRRLRIGYVSPDFRHHVVGQNLRPLFANHNHEQFGIFCYSDVRRVDSMTQWFKQHAEHWRQTADFSDEQLAAKIREDRIDVLVDLALHTQENRLLTFARKPAPVQVSFAGYPADTGVAAIDYHLSDPYLDPPAIEDSRIIRLPHSFWCYDPGDCNDIAVNLLPALKSKHITFGCLNNFCKINPLTLSLWARVMQKVPGSRLILLAKQGHHRERTIESLYHQGIDRNRVEFTSFMPRRNYLEQFHRIDISLDTFPYNGHSTSLDSLWMGVPVVTWIGQTSVARAGWCQLSNLGLNELAGDTADDFIQIAANLAGDLPRLDRLRRTLRSKMECSVLMSPATFSRNVEAAFRSAWQRRLLTDEWELR